MTRINVRSIRDMSDSMMRYGSSFQPGDHDTLEWQIRLPGANGLALDFPLAPGFSCTIFRLRSRKRLVVPVKVTNPERLVKVGIATRGHLSLDLAGARRDYDSFAGQFFLGAYDGETELEISVPEAAQIETLQLHLSLPAFRRACERRDLRIHDSFAQAVAGPSPVPFKFASVVPPALLAHAQRSVRGAFRSRSVAPEAFIELAARIVACLSEPRRWAARVVSPCDICRVTEARQRILREFRAPPSVQELARELGMNEFKLKCGYRQAFGTSIGSDCRVVRLRRAAELISSTELSLTEIALEVGYGNPGDFGVYFRRHFGLTPSAYRSEVRRHDL